MVELNEKALPAPDDGLVERLKAGSIALKNDRPASSTIMEEAATALQSKDEQIERLKNLNADLLTQAKGHAQEARTANGTIYEIYQVLSGGKGEPGNWHGAEPARRYVETAEQQVQKLTAENERLKGAPRRIADKRNHHFSGDAQVVARSALETQEGGK